MVRIRLTQVNFKGQQMGSVIRVHKSEAKALVKWNLAVEEPEKEPTEKTAKKKKTPRPDKSGPPSTEGNVKTEK